MRLSYISLGIFIVLGSNFLCSLAIAASQTNEANLVNYSSNYLSEQSSHDLHHHLSNNSSHDFPNNSSNLENLNPNPNPLLAPTQPIEVNITDTQPITLQQAIDLALQNNLDLQKTRQELERDQAALQQARAANLPTLNASTSFTHAESQQQVASLGGSSSSLQTTDSNTLSGTVEANYSLFTSGQRSVNIQAAATQVRYQELAIEAKVQETTLDVTNDYYDLQDADEQVRIYKDTLTQAQHRIKQGLALILMCFRRRCRWPMPSKT